MSKWIPLLIAALAAPALAVQTSHWTSTNEADFKNGTLHNVVATNLGDLKLSRTVKTLMEQDAKVSAVYALAAAKDGTVYAGTGPQGVVLQINGDKVKELMHLEDVTNVFSLIVAKDGSLLVGTGGETGEIYRIAHPGAAGAKPEKIFSADGVQYIWCLTQTPDGTIYAGTGPTGKLYEIKPDGSHDVLLDTEENNILCMVSDGNDLLYAGTDPDGLVYRVNRKTRDAYVVHDAPESEIGALALDDQGNLYAGTAEAMEQAGGQAPAESEKIGRPEGATSGVPIPAPPRPEPKPPEVPNPNPGEPEPIPKNTVKKLMLFDILATDSSSTKQTDQQRRPMPPPGGPPNPATGPAAASPGIMPPTGLTAQGTAGQPPAGGNAIYRIDKNGLVHEIFREPVLVMSMIFRDGVLLVGTGSDGQIFQINPQQQETIALAKVDAKQVMTMLPADGRIILGLANTGGVAALTQGYATEGTYTSAVLDAGQVSRFGKMQLHGLLPKGTTLKVQTRSGNISDPTDTFWSKWTEPVSAEEFLPVKSPNARFLQYRIDFASDDGKKTPVVDDVDVAYQVPNMAPVIKAIKVSATDKSGDNASSSSSAVSGSAKTQTVAWEASDPNNDELAYSLYYRHGSRAPWILLKDKLKETTWDWNTRTVADGWYEVKVVASDALANAPGDGRQTSRISDPVLVDNTPPVIGDLTSSSGAGDVRVEFDATDATGTLAAFAYTVDSSEQWQTVLPSDKIADSPQEHVNFVVHGLSPGNHQIAVRATDSAGNSAVTTVNVAIDAAAKP